MQNEAVSAADAPDFDAIKAKQQATWASGDYAQVGSALVLMAEALVEAMDVRSGWRVLDVAAGSGNASLAAARRGCRVTSTDYVPALLDRGKARAEAEGVRVEFQEADVEKLPFGDGVFDAVVSTVGVMFAPNQERAAAEMYRVCKVGGKIGLANWTPAGFVGQIFRCIGRYVAPAAGLKPPSVWGTEERLRELFPGASGMSVLKKEFVFRAVSPEAWLEHFKTYYGPMHRTFAGLDEAGRVGLTGDLMDLVGSLNRVGDGGMVLGSEYLEVVIRK